MQPRIKAVEPGEINPFDNCKLHREEIANTLTNFLDNQKDGFVMAINNKWGAGKTTFVKMWQKSLESKYSTIYFNAWESDFNSDPFISLVGELNSVISPDKYQKLTEKASKILAAAFPAILRGLSKKLTGSDEFADAIKDASKESVSIYKKELEDYAKKKKSLESFRAMLKAYIEEECKGNKLIFIIDELDRCRPDFAVELLEKVKHIFSLDNIYFILSIDKKQLSYAIQGFYGSDNIDTNEYLRKFINIEYTLPSPNPDLYFDYLLSKTNFGENSSPSMVSHLKQFNFVKDLTLRQLESVFFILDSYFGKSNQISFQTLEMVFFLIILKITDKEEYYKIKNLEYKINEFQDAIYPLFKLNNGGSTEQFLAHSCILLEAALIYFYSHDKLGNHMAFKSWDKSLENKFIKVPQYSKIEPNGETVKYESAIRELLSLGISPSLLGFIKKIEAFNNFKGSI